MPESGYNSAMNAPVTYRLVGIRADDSREVLGQGLTREQLSHLFMEFMESKEYPSLAVEPE